MPSPQLPDGWDRPVLPGSWELWKANLRPPNSPILYHYTTADALINILSQRKMWATNLLFVNDPAELVHAQAVVSRAIEWASTTYCVDEKASQLLRKWIGGFDEIVAMILRETDFYSISLCEDGDLLSQWRSYGSAGGGFAIGWSTASKFPAGGLRASIEYRADEQERLIRETFKLHVEALLGTGGLATLRDWGPFHDALTYSLGSQITFYLYAFKHPSYAAEQELRLIYAVEKGTKPPGEGPYFRQFATMVKPYIEVSFETPQLAEVVYGPAADARLTERWLRQFLDERGLDGVPIRRSSIPMR